MANGDFIASQLALIKSARSLESDTRPFNDKINNVWRLLTAAKGGKSCAAEETILRWFLKHMDGGSEAAEQLRRFPLTWTTIGCLFERISLFSLSRIFLERKFIAVLQRTAKDISKPQTPESSKTPDSKKRKRDDPNTFDIDSLRSPETLLFSATEFFKALDCLLVRLDATTKRDAEDVLIGAEHIKSLFRVPANEAKELVAPLLWTCTRSLDLLHQPHGGLFEQQEKWPKILIALWDLHLGGAEDPQEFAGHLYLPCCIIIDKLSDGMKIQGNLERKSLWKRQFDQFVTKNLANPARNAFTNGHGLGVLDIAYATASRDPEMCAKVIWRLAVASQSNIDDPTSKKARLVWTQTVFKSLLAFLEEHKKAEAVVPKLLDAARFSGCSPELETLTYVCKQYCFQDSETDWDFVSNIIQCDSDTFLLNEDILSNLLERLTSVTEAEDFEIEQIVQDVINPLMEASAKARDLIGFVKRWHSQLSHLFAKGAFPKSSPWLDHRVRKQYGSLMQGALSLQQLSTLVDWLQDQASDGARLAILDAICQGLTDEAYAAAVTSRLLQVVLQDKEKTNATPSLLSVWWRIVGATASWVDAAEVHRIWKHVRGRLSKVLSNGPLSDAATYEAFGCCAKLCLLNYPQGRDLSNSVIVAGSFLKRITAETQDSSCVASLSPYLEIIFEQFPTLSSVSGEDGTIGGSLALLYSRLESSALELPKKDVKELLDRIPRDHVVEDEEELLDALIQPLLAALEGTDTCPWTKASSEMTISTLLGFSADLFTKDRRKRIMSSWKKWKPEIDAHASNNISFYKLVLRLQITAMAQATFYEGMVFDDIRDLSGSSEAETLPFVERLVQLTISQVIGNVESSADYLKHMLNYVNEISIDEASIPTMPLVLLKSMASALKRSSSKARSCLNQAQVIAKLRELVSHSISEFSSKLKKPGKLTKDKDILTSLDLTLRAAVEIGESMSVDPIKLSSKVSTRLEEAGEALTSQGMPVGWQLQTFLAYNQKSSDSTLFLKQMSQSYSAETDSQSVTRFVDAVTRSHDPQAKLGLLREALASTATWQSPSVPYLMMSRIIETIQVPGTLTITTEDGKSFDLASVQIILSRLLTQKRRSLEEFKNITQVLELLLDKQSNSMTQINVEQTLAVIATVCSPSGPPLSASDNATVDDSSVAGVVFDNLYRLVAIVIKRHRLRLEGHHHLLVTALQTLLRVLLANPANAKQSNSSFLYPPWLDTRLKARHGAKFARLLTLICEPSAASVARGKQNSLDSATDAVKRSAGQHMFWVVAMYIKLQLEGDVSREMRKELTTGVHSILTITPEPNRRILNEAMDESGRAIFRSLFTEWKKFGKWSGV